MALKLFLFFFKKFECATGVRCIGSNKYPGAPDTPPLFGLSANSLQCSTLKENRKPKKKELLVPLKEQKNWTPEFEFPRINVFFIIPPSSLIINRSASPCCTYIYSWCCALGSNPANTPFSFFLLFHPTWWHVGPRPDRWDQCSSAYLNKMWGAFAKFN